MGMYEDGTKCEKSVDEAFQTHTTPATPGCKLVSTYQAGADVRVMYKMHKSNLYSNIQESSTNAKNKEP